MTIEYQLGKLNATTDALSRKARLGDMEKDEFLVPMQSQEEFFTHLQDNIQRD